MDQKLIKAISSTSKTALITIHAHSIESQSADPIIDDPEAVVITEALKEALSQSGDRLLMKLAAGKLNPQLRYHIAIRAWKYDRYAEQFIAEYPEGTVINIGCGLDSRYQRLKNKPKLYMDVDLPEMIAIKKELFVETEGYRLMGQSIFDEGWFSALEKIPGPKLFIAEGLFMYLDPELLNPWLKKLATTFSGSRLLFETVVEKYTRGFNKKMVEFKLRKELGVTGDVSYHFGLKDSRDLEQLSSKYELIEDWSYFDEKHPKVGWMNVMGKVKSLRYVQWTVYYKIK